MIVKNIKWHSAKQNRGANVSSICMTLVDGHLQMVFEHFLPVVKRLVQHSCVAAFVSTSEQMVHDG